MKLTGRLYFLDALRGLAAMSVMFFHFFARGVSPIHAELAGSIPAWSAWSIGRLYCGVEVFFVLSGFVIAFAMDGHTTNFRYAGNFIVRRSLRLDPPYWVAAALTLAYFLIRWPGLGHDFYLAYGGVKGVAANLFYVQNLSWICPTASILDVSWTLCLEVQFYLTYLLILVAGHYVGRLMNRRAPAIERWIIVLAVTGVACWSLGSWLGHHRFNFSGRAWAFFTGVGIYFALTRRAPIMIVAILLTALAVMFVCKKDATSIVTVTTASAIYFVGMSGRLSTLLASRPLLHLGKISYSIYLLHMVIGLNLLDILASASRGSAAKAWMALLLAVLASLLGAELLHRFIEAPANRLSQRLKRPRPAKIIRQQPFENLLAAAAAG